MAVISLSRQKSSDSVISTVVGSTHNQVNMMIVDERIEAFVSLIVFAIGAVGLGLFAPTLYEIVDPFLFWSILSISSFVLGLLGEPVVQVRRLRRWPRAIITKNSQQFEMSLQ